MKEFKIDTYFIDLFANVISDKLTPFVKIITYFGSTVTFIVLCILFLIFLKNKKTSIFITINLISIALLNYIIKIIVQRPRPNYNTLIDISGYSFPSGHSAVSMAFYGFLIYLVNKYISNKNLKIILTVLLSILILLIGLSRVYLGVHYITDVIAGFTLGFIYLLIFIKTIKNHL